MPFTCSAAQTTPSQEDPAEGRRRLDEATREASRWRRRRTVITVVTRKVTFA